MALAGVIVMLAGSDLPPPPGFAVVLVAAAGLGLLVRWRVPVLLRRVDAAGAVRATPALVGPVAVYSAAVALIAALIGSDEGSLPAPTWAETAVFVLVAAVAGCVAALLVVIVAVLADRERARPSRAVVVAVALPVLLVALLCALAVALA
mgnify:FL=1